MLPEQPVFAAYSTEVRPEWVDYNGHMGDASYGVVLSAANEEVLEVLGMSADYRAATGAALYTVEAHIRYLAECALGDTLRARTIVVDADARRLRLYTELVLEDGRVAATGEVLYLHVNEASGVADMPPDRRASVEAALSAQAGVPRPSHLGAGIALTRAKPGAVTGNGTG